MHGHIGLIRAMHTQPAQTLAVALRVRANAHQRGGNREAKLLHQVGQAFACLACYHTATGIEHWALGLQHHLDGFLDLPGMPTGHRIVGAQFDLLRVHVLVALGGRGHVLGDIDHHRARTTGRCQIEGLFQHFWDFGRVTNREAVLHDRTRHANDIGFLEGVVTNQVAHDLAAQNNHGNGVHVGGRNASHRVGSAGARGHQHHAGLAGGTGIAVGSVGGCLFVPHEDVLHFVLAEQRIINMQRRATGITINVLDALILQEAGDHICAGKQFHCVSPLEVSSAIRRTSCGVECGGMPLPAHAGT